MDYDGGRESIWGIDRRDRRWFQTLTLVGGTVTSIVFGVLHFRYRSPYDTADEILLNLLLGIGAGFVASGFVAWGLLQLKEMAMAIADWIREATEKRRQRLIEQGRLEGRQEGRQEGIQIGREQGRVEGYEEGYIDGKEGNPPQPLTGDSESPD